MFSHQYFLLNGQIFTHCQEYCFPKNMKSFYLRYFPPNVLEQHTFLEELLLLKYILNKEQKDCTSFALFLLHF